MRTYILIFVVVLHFCGTAFCSADHAMERDVAYKESLSWSIEKQSSVLFEDIALWDIEKLKDEAEDGDAVAQRFYGFYLFSLENPKRQEQEGIDWLLQSAKSGDVFARRLCCIIYMDGVINEEKPRIILDAGEVFQWLTEYACAFGGDAIVNNCLGFCYAKGVGTGVNFFRAYDFWNRTVVFKESEVRAESEAASEAMASIVMLAIMTEAPVLFRPNVDIEKIKSYEPYIRARAEAGNYRSQLILACWLYRRLEMGIGNPSDPKDAFFWANQVASLKKKEYSAIGHLIVGMCFKDGVGVVRDLGMAVSHLLIASDEGEPQAKTILLQFFSGVKYLAERAKRGSPTAKQVLDELVSVD